jgi:hypothetical protein
VNQIWQSTVFKALRKPPNASSRQGSVLLAAFVGWEMAGRLISIGFGVGLGWVAVATFFGLGSGPWRWITLGRAEEEPALGGSEEELALGGSEEPMLIPSDGEIRSSTKAGCAGVSLLATAISSRSAFANASCESEISMAGAARGWTTATALRGGVLSSIAASTPTPSGMKRPNNSVLSMILLRLALVPAEILRSNEATWRRLT